MKRPHRLYLLITLIVLSVGCVEENTIRASETRDLMGTEARIIVIGADNESAHDAISQAFDEIVRIDAILSNYKNDSQVSILNRNGKLENAGPDILLNIKKSIFYSELTDGAFDITVQPILDLYGETYALENRSPTDTEIQKTLELVGYERIAVDGSNIRFENDAMSITLGGIAKGYAVDMAIGVLEKMGVEKALIDMGGDIRVLGQKENSQDWDIALVDPRNKSRYITQIKLNNKSVATSGDYERYFIDKKAHHIINPMTGHSASGLISVTIITEKAIDADSLATSVFVLGPDKGMELIERLDHVDGLLITENKTIIRSSNFIY